MMRLTSFVQGRWATDGPVVGEVHAAATGAVLGQVIDGVDRGAALRWARQTGGPTLRAMSFAQRGAVLKALSRAVHQHRAELLELSALSYGATRHDAKFDVDGASGTLAWYASLGEKLGDRTFLLDGEPVVLGRSPRFVGQHLLVPREGVALHINAFNFPAWGMCEKLAVSLLAGVPAVVKPAMATCPVTWRIVQIWEQEGLFPAGAVSLLVGSAGDLLDHLQGQDVIAFTGSGETAQRIRGHGVVLALNIPVNVEADSLNASVLGPDADGATFELFVGDVVRDLLQKAGQKCTAVRRVLVPEDRLGEVHEAVAERLSAVTLGDPESRDGVAPLATAAQHRDISEGIERLAGATEPWAAVSALVPTEGWYVAPRIFLARGGAEAPFVHDHEVFGPVASVLPYDGSVAEASAIVRRGGGGLVASVYSDDVAWAGALITQLAPWHGRVFWGSSKIADASPGPGTVLPQLVHGGPGKAGGGEELGGERGLRFYWQRTAVQGDRALMERAFGAEVHR